MTVYYAVYGLLLALARLVRRGPAYWLALVGLTLFAGLRYWVGCDFSGYLNNWELMRGATLPVAFAFSEPAHWALIILLQGWGFAYTHLLLVAAIIFFAGFHALARRQPHPMAMLALAFPVLIINMPMSGIRQAEAIGLMCLAFNAFVDRAVVRYVAFVLLAALFHGSAMVFLALAPFIRLRFSFRNALLGLVLLAPGLWLMAQSGAADTAISRYVGTGIDAAGAAFRLLILVLSGAAYLWKIRPLWREAFPADYKLVTIGAWMMVAFFALFPISSVIGDRFGYYLIPLQLVIFARLPYLPGLPNRKLWIAAPWVLLSLVFVVWTTLSGHFHQCYVPYQMGIYEG
ncbi:MAG: EpsG family protein [Alphaproteobacteria bacterium]|nr:MAG: EpsG family protein [Alphaproteobacteria bacterium]